MATLTDGYRFQTAIKTVDGDRFNEFVLTEVASGRFPYRLSDYLPGWFGAGQYLYCETDMLPSNFLEEFTAMENRFLGL
jgi:hypothetical protein